MFNTHYISPTTIIVLILTLCSAKALSACNTALITSTPGVDFTHESAREYAVVSDKKTGLTWTVCSVGKTWNEQLSDCMLDTNKQNLFTWQEALQFANNLVYANHSDWRLPNKKELASIIEYKCYAPAINDSVFPSSFSGEYWTSSPVPYASSAFAWYIDFRNGSFSSGPIEVNRHIILVR